jgi:hypothetical protein
MEKLKNSPEDIEKVRQVAEETKSAILSMGNTDNREFERIDKIFEDFKLADGQVSVETAINMLRAVPWSKQEV